jgi:YVTN family beta-propeller protein
MTNDHGTDSGTLTRIDAATGKVLASIQVRPKSHAILVAYGSVWVTSAGESSLTRIDPQRNTASAEMSVHPLPRFIAAGAGSLWVLSQRDGVLSRIDPQTNRVIATVNVGVPGEGGDLAIAEGFVWVGAEGVPVSQIDPRSIRLARQYVGGSKDDTLRVGFGAAWVVDEDNGEIWRIDLRALARKTSWRQSIASGENRQTPGMNGVKPIRQQISVAPRCRGAFCWIQKFTPRRA